MCFGDMKISGMRNDYDAFLYFYTFLPNIHNFY